MTPPTPCPTCSARPLPPWGGKGRKPTRCLKCTKDAGSGSWRQFLTRYVEQHGEDAGRALAQVQGVPFTPAAARAGGEPPAGKVVAFDVLEGGGGGGQRAAGEPPRIEPRTVEPTRLAGLSGHALELALENLIRVLPEISPGQLAQTVKPVHGIYSEMAGGTTAGTILSVMADEDPRAAKAAILDFLRSGELTCAELVDDIKAAGLWDLSA